MKRFLVVGLGRFGRSLAETLASEGGEVIAIDAEMHRVEEIKEKVSHAVQLDGTDPDALKSVGADRVDAAIIAIGENFEASVVTTTILKELGLKEIIVRAYTKREERILQMIGATRIIFVEDEMGRRLGKTFCGNALLDYIELSPTQSIIQWEIPERLAGKSLADLGLETKWNLTLIAVKKKGNPLPGFLGRKGPVRSNFIHLPKRSSPKEIF
ncbi:MAG: TrkA family potassium uptake protein [Candidatus Manganitrophus sp.]|nr:TrkA family potassium uptake protein [Candidatus Manganitrophus sp.]